MADAPFVLIFSLSQKNPKKSMGSRRKRGQFPGLSGKLREIHLYEKGERRPKRKKSRSLTEREGGGMIFDRTDVLDKRFGF
ncbi:MAG: hypothetical protein SOY66_01775 [Evtepia sp.]|nr:hypothetical protein [Evtepia sp.]